MEKIKLTYSQKKELRNLYGSYEYIKNNEFSTPEERKRYRQEIIDEVKEKFPDVVNQIREEHKSEKDNIMMYLPELIYSKNQLKFIEDAENEGHEIDYSYSGRGMFGDSCPAVCCDSHNDLHTEARTSIDSMGLGIVIYAKN